MFDHIIFFCNDSIDFKVSKEKRVQSLVLLWSTNNPSPPYFIFFIIREGGGGSTKNLNFENKISKRITKSKFLSCNIYVD